MKKHMSVLAVLMASAVCFTACKTNTKKSDDKKLSIVTTIFPEYDWVMNILGDKKDSADVTMLLDNGVDLHSYQPTADDIVKIKSCDMFIYVGGESDEWVEDVLETAENKDMVVVNLLEELGGMVKEEELIEGMQDEEHDHHHTHGDEGIRRTLRREAHQEQHRSTEKNGPGLLIDQVVGGRRSELRIDLAEQDDARGGRARQHAVERKEGFVTVVRVDLLAEGVAVDVGEHGAADADDQ